MSTTTHWSVVLAAARDESPDAPEALAQLCRTYWYPLYAYVRRKGHDAQDLTQEFLARLLEGNYLRGVHPSKGSFRSFLRASLNHFLANEWRRSQAQKRGSGSVSVSLDAETAEGRYRLEASDDATPDKIYERRWAMTVLDQEMGRLREGWR